MYGSIFPYGAFPVSVDQDQTAQNVQSDVDQHCLLL